MDKLTPDEFEQVYEKWSDSRDAEYRNEWEQTRLKCFYIARPTLKNPRMAVTTFMPFPWEKRRKGEGGKGRRGEREKVHDPERFERLKKKYGATI
jgi:hypothetical protein